MPLQLGTVGHFGISVRDPQKSARWWIKTLNVRRRFSFPGGVVVGSNDVDIVLHKGKPNPKVVHHISFHVRGLRELKAALAELQRKNVKLEDPGREIGPEGPGSKNMGLWFYDPDGYRFELSALETRKRKSKAKRKRG